MPISFTQLCLQLEFHSNGLMLFTVTVHAQLLVSDANEFYLGYRALAPNCFPFKCCDAALTVGLKRKQDKLRA